MGTREKMIKYRIDHNLPYDYISQKTGISVHLLTLIEDGYVTHPLIVNRIKDFYSLTDLEAEELLPKNRREHDSEYEPDKYVVPVPNGADKVMPRQTLIERYMTEHLSDQAKLHTKRSNY